MGRSVKRSKSRRGKSNYQKRGNKNATKTQPIEEIQQIHGVDLNDDCFIKIFEYLEIVDLVNAAAASTKFEAIARNVFSRKFAKDVVTVSNKFAALTSALNCKLCYNQLLGILSYFRHSYK